MLVDNQILAVSSFDRPKCPEESSIISTYKPSQRKLSLTPLIGTKSPLPKGSQFDQKS